MCKNILVYSYGAIWRETKQRMMRKVEQLGFPAQKKLFENMEGEEGVRTIGVRTYFPLTPAPI